MVYHYSFHFISWHSFPNSSASNSLFFTLLEKITFIYFTVWWLTWFKKEKGKKERKITFVHFKWPIFQPNGQFPTPRELEECADSTFVIGPNRASCSLHFAPRIPCSFSFLLLSWPLSFTSSSAASSWPPWSLYLERSDLSP